jgi:hypothetical protein
MLCYNSYCNSIVEANNKAEGVTFFLGCCFNLLHAFAGLKITSFLCC